VYFCEKGKTVPMLIFTVLLLGVKEDAAVYAAVIAIYFLFASKNYKCNLFMLILSVVWFIVVTNHLSKHGDGVMTYRYGKYIYDGSGSLLTMFKAIAKDPIFVIKECFTKEKLMFILQMLLPLFFLPPNLSQRKVIYELEYTKQQAEYYVLDLRYDTDEYSISDYMTPDFTVPFYEEGVASDMADKKIVVIQGYTGETCVKKLGYAYQSFKKGNKELLDQINKTIKKMKDDGKIAELSAKYADVTDTDSSSESK